MGNLAHLNPCLYNQFLEQISFHEYQQTFTLVALNMQFLGR